MTVKKLHHRSVRKIKPHCVPLTNAVRLLYMHGMTQQQMADAVGVSQPWISRALNKSLKSVSPEHMELLLGLCRDRYIEVPFDKEV